MKKNTKHNTYIPSLSESFKFMGESHEEYDIPKSSYNKLFGEYTTPDNYTDAINSIKEVTKSYLDMIYGNNHTEIIDYLVNNVTPTFRYHGAPYNGWRLELSGRNIINNIYKYFNISEVSNIYNTSKHLEKVALEADTSKKLFDILNEKDLSINDTEFLKDTIKNINKITNINETELDDMLRGKYLTKDLLFTLGFVSLNSYEKTGNALYLNFAKKYYNMLTKPNKPLEWPHWVTIDGKLKKDYEDFKKEYVKVLGEVTNKKEDNMKTPIRFGDSFIKAGSLSEELNKTDKLIEKAKTESSKDEKVKSKELEILQRLREKQEFFKDLGASRMIYGKDELLGYIGFVFDDITVFDKFYTGKRLIKPAKDNAIYYMNNDIIDNMVFQSKQDILKYIKQTDNNDIGRIIHDKKGNYKDKVKTLIKTKKDV